MATFTIVLKNVIDLVNATPENNYTPIGLGEYPIFEEAHRSVLNKKIVDRYWNREIGVETIEMFSFAMKRKLNEIMPYYNQLYESEQIDYEALITMDITTVASSESSEDTVGTGTSNATSDTNSDSRSVQSTTPQTMLSGNEDYASSAADVSSDSTVGSDSSQTSDSSSNSATDANSHVTGYQGIPANLIMAFRASLLNIDMMVLSDIEDLFMLVWDNGDVYASRSSTIGYF